MQEMRGALWADANSCWLLVVDFFITPVCVCSKYSYQTFQEPNNPRIKRHSSGKYFQWKWFPNPWKALLVMFTRYCSENIDSGGMWGRGYWQLSWVPDMTKYVREYTICLIKISQTKYVMVGFSSIFMKWCLCYWRYRGEDPSTMFEECIDRRLYYRAALILCTPIHHAVNFGSGPEGPELEG